MFTSTEPFLSAELAYRYEQMVAGRSGAVSSRRRWHLPALGSPSRRLVHRPVAGH